MFFKYPRSYNTLRIDDGFAQLNNIRENGDLEFEFCYRLSQQEAVQQQALSVKVSVFSRSITRKSLLVNSARGDIDTRGLIRNVLSQMPDAKSAAKQQEGFVVASRNSDVTSKINNEVVGQFQAHAPKESIQQLFKPKLKLVSSGEVKASNEAKPLLLQVAYPGVNNVEAIQSSSIDVKPTALMHDMIVRQGTDPSHILALTHRSIPASDAVGGTLRKRRAVETEGSPTSRLLDHHVLRPDVNARAATTSDVQDSTLVQVLVNDVNDEIEVPVKVTIPNRQRLLEGRDNSHYFVKFELIDGKSGVAVDSITKTLDVTRHVQLYYTPRRPPVVNVSRSEVSTRANLEIKQVDRGATGVQVFKKNLYKAVAGTDDYVLIGTFNVKHNEQSLIVQVDLPKNSTAIYRVVPVGPQGTQGFEYANVIVNPSRFKPIKSLSLVAQAVDIGVKLEARNIPQHVVSVEFLARNLSIFEREYRNVGGSVYLVDDAARAADYLSIVDRDVSPNHIYEYIAKMIYASGSEELSTVETLEFVQPAPGKVDTRVSDLDVSHDDDPNVTFTITTNIVDSDIDIIKSLLQRQDVYDLFKDDVLREREFLKSLIAHNVQRIDLTTGRREDFGVVTVNTFSDRDLRKNQAIEPLRLGRKYRYEITALLRSPETLFETFKKERVDEVTKKSYSFSPAKFMHPLALNRGLLVTSRGLKTRFAKEALAHGTLGSTTFIEVSFDEEPARVVEPASTRFNRSLNVITWKLQGSIDQIDHFLLLKDVNGVRTAIGKAHSEFLYGNCQYLHELSDRDSGALTYVIVPIFNDYKVGTEAATNVVIV